MSNHIEEDVFHPTMMSHPTSNYSTNYAIQPAPSEKSTPLHRHTTSYANDMAESGHCSRRKTASTESTTHSKMALVRQRRRMLWKDDATSMSSTSRSSSLFVIYQFLARLSGRIHYTSLIVYCKTVTVYFGLSCCFTFFLSLGILLPF